MGVELHHLKNCNVMILMKQGDKINEDKEDEGINDIFCNSPCEGAKIVLPEPSPRFPSNQYPSLLHSDE